VCWCILFNHHSQAKAKAKAKANATKKKQRARDANNVQIKASSSVPAERMGVAYLSSH
jgi:hypothetical protein